jgi:hypothetical protein
MSAGRRDRHAGRGGFPHEINLRRGQGVGLVDEVAEGALQVHFFGGAGAGGRAEKLKLGKQKAAIARRRVRRSAAVSCPGCASLSHNRREVSRNRPLPRLVEGSSGEGPGHAAWNTGPGRASDRVTGEPEIVPRTLTAFLPSLAGCHYPLTRILLSRCLAKLTNDTDQ